MRSAHRFNPRQGAPTACGFGPEAYIFALDPLPAAPSGDFYDKGPGLGHSHISIWAYIRLGPNPICFIVSQINK